jgi:hypothetical protein
MSAAIPSPKFADAEVAAVLADLQRCYPSATEDDARTILMDAHWAESDERDFVAREVAAMAAELEFMAVSA